MLGDVDLERHRRGRKRQARLLFFVAGISFGTVVWFLRTRMPLGSQRRQLALVGLVALMVLTFWLGSRAEAQAQKIEEELKARRDEKKDSDGPN